MHRRLGSVAVLLASSVIVGCRDVAKPRKLSSVSITLERTPCYGICPAYTVTLHGNGAVEYFGKSRVDMPGSQKGSVDPRHVLDLLQTLKEIHFFELQERYFEDCSDLPTAIVTLREDGRFKQVSNYYGGCERKTSGPQVDLAKLSGQIDAIAQSSRWVVCNSECVKELAQTGLNVNASGPDGETALLVAIREGDFSKMRALLDAGANLNVANSEESWTGLSFRTTATS